MAQSYAERKASLRRRTGLTPYEQRKKAALAKGKTVAEARGHATGRSRDTEYRRRVRQRFGASPETMRRLRRQVVEHGYNIIMALPLNPRPPKGYDYYGESRKAIFRKDVCAANIRPLTAEALLEMLDWDARTWQMEAIGPVDDEFIEANTAPTVHVPESGAWNPRWYHSMGGFR